jgi:hypothetical protein
MLSYHIAIDTTTSDDIKSKKADLIYLTGWAPAPTTRITHLVTEAGQRIPQMVLPEVGEAVVEA